MIERGTVFRVTVFVLFIVAVVLGIYLMVNRVTTGTPTPVKPVEPHYHP